jgi:FkbM family methyltransferase
MSFRRPLKIAEKVLARVIPDALYFSLQDRVRPALDRRTTATGRAVRKWGSGYKVRWEDGTEFAFPHKLRYCRYMFPEGLDHVFDCMLAKYQDNTVQIEAGDVLFEVGANVGEFSLAAVRMGAKVYAAEPDPNAARCLRENVPEAMLIEAVVGNRKGRATLNVSTAGADSSVVNPSPERISVPAITVASWLERTGEECIDFLKIGAEGYEPEVLEGARPVFDRIHKIAIDCGPERKGKSPWVECSKALEDAFEVWRREWMLFAVRRSSTGASAFN